MLRLETGPSCATSEGADGKSLGIISNSALMDSQEFSVCIKWLSEVLRLLLPLVSLFPPLV